MCVSDPADPYFWYKRLPSEEEIEKTQKIIFQQKSVPKKSPPMQITQWSKKFRVD